MNVFDRIDSRLGLSDDEELLLESVRGVARDVIAPRAAEHDRLGTFPHDNVEALNALGLNAMFVPERYGGAGLSYRAYLACVREISAACASTGIIWATNFHAIKPIIDFGSDELRERVLPRVAAGALCALVVTEPEAGSDATGMRTTLSPDDNDIVVDGLKTFITNGDVAEFYLVFGKWAGETDPRKAISCVLVERTEAAPKVIRLEDKLGHRASSTATLAFERCHTSSKNLVAGPGQGLPLLLSSLNKSRPSVAAHALGIAHAAFDDAVSYANSRRQFGKKIVEFQGNQFLLADLATELAFCDAFLAHVAREIEAGTSDIGIEASMLKLRASDVAMRMTTEAIQLHGGYGYCKDFRVERLFRDAKITQIWEGTNQIHRQNIGRSFFAR